MHWYIWSMLWLIHIIFLNFSTELWPLIEFRIMFMLTILWNNWWIWSNLVTLIFFMPKRVQQQKWAHVVLATLLYRWLLGLQRYTELSSIRDMDSGEPAYCIASRIFARFANFLEPVIVLKIDKFPDKIYLCFNSPWQPLFPVKCMWLYVVSAQCANLCLHFGTQ